MLQLIKIKNFAIIEEETIKFEAGFTAMTGETGAGKSIILDAMQLILGGRASADMVRHGERNATIYAEFKVPAPLLSIYHQRLKELSLPVKGVTLIIKRSVSVDGRNRITVNGRSCTAANLRELTIGLVEIVRQHESYQLLDPLQHLSQLDRFAELTNIFNDFQTQYTRWQSLELERKNLIKSQHERSQRLQVIQSQIDHIERLGPEPGEDERIERELKLLHSAEELNQWLNDGIHSLYERPRSLIDEISNLSTRLEPLTPLDTRLQTFYEALERAHLELDELTHDLRRFRGEIPSDQDQISALETRRIQLDQLKDEYHLSLEEIIEHAETFKEERAALEALDLRIIAAEIEAKEAHASAILIAKELSERRYAASNHMSQLVEEELQTLGMSRCRFKVDFKKNKLCQTGLDQVEFLISPNPGEGFKSLARIASGGELSRLTLALKVVLMHADLTPVYVFDEVDSGIGGGIAEGVGRKLKRISSQRQVICITHLPQVCSCANHHMKIYKVLSDDRTFSTITSLTLAARRDEVARMLGGQDLTEATLIHAQEMLERGRF